MTVKITKEELMNFESEIKELFLEKKILSPVHLCGGNETQLIYIFDHIKHEDYVCSTHRSHYHALLKGIPKDWLKQEILSNRSIHIFNKEHNFISSAIVGGIIPIALGIALSLKLNKSDNKVWCLIGDMAAETGSFSECTKYAKNFDLPIIFVVEDNDMSTDVPTRKVWGNTDRVRFNSYIHRDELSDNCAIWRYRYQRIYPHVGVGQWVSF